MTTRRYRQYCPIAYGLDAVGERWTLLIVRELLVGPKRFTDLLRTLPGIGPNLLTQRLKALEDRGLAARRTLPPPAGSTVYRLTDAGEGLAPLLRELALWGERFVEVPRPSDHHFGVTIAMSALRTRFAPETERLTDLSCTVHSDLDPFHIVVAGPRLTLDLGELATSTMTLRFARLEDFPALIARHLGPDQAIAEGRLVIERGDRAGLLRLLAMVL